MIKITSWNINSVRARLAIVEQLIELESPDVICLQEIKVETDAFPKSFFTNLGYEHQAIAGQKGHHGVATLSRIPLKHSAETKWCGKDDARHIATTLENDIEVHNFYVPAGGDIPDVVENEKFAHKMQFLDEMTSWSKAAKGKQVLLGDLNIAPLESDVWSHKALKNTISHTAIEIEKLDTLFKSNSWIDAVRHFVPEDEALFSWWSYRAKDWLKANKGRRLDHIWVTENLKDQLHKIDIVKDARGWEKPSDHAPVTLTLKN
ncbi:MAG: exodeoxyribonuclease III [Sphingomonadales bacterium]|nr:exodeoxyribonuclease III [Sphingomonadales bacterium]